MPNSPLLWLVALAATISCQADLKFPKGVAVECESTAECPPDYVCKAAVHRCVLASGADQSPPKVEASSMEPTALRQGSTTQIELVVDEALLIVPTVHVGTASALGAGNQGRVYRFAYTASGDETEGDVDVTVDMVDSLGNESSVNIGALVFDFTDPTIVGDITTAVAGVPSTGVSYIGAGQRGTIDLEVGETLSAPPTITLSNGLVMTDTVDLAAPDYRYGVTPDGTEPDGGLTARITLVDQAGNSSTEVTDLLFNFDFTAPALDGSLPPQLLSSSVSPGRLVGVTCWTTEALGQAATVELVPQATGPTLSMDESQRIAKEQSFRYQVDVADADGPYDIVLSAMVDRAGNAAGPFILGTVVIDGVGPLVSNVQVSPERVSWQSGFNSLTVSFDVDEDVGTTPPELLVRLGSTMLTSCLSSASGPVSYSCDYTVDPGDLPGLKPISITVTDAAANAGFAATEVIFDDAAPTISLATVSYLQPAGSPLVDVARARAGTTIRITVLPSETLGAATPTLVLRHSGSGALVAAVVNGDASQGNVTFEVLVPAGAADGVYLPEIAWTDLAGNQGPAVGFLDPEIAVKTTVPVLNVAQSEILYVRSPQGQSQEESLGSFTIPAGPYFALAPPDPLADVDSIATGTLLLDGTDLPQLIRVWADSSRTLLMGTARPNGDETWPRLRLASVDAPAIYVSALDDAGNESDAVKIDQAEWVASGNPPPFGSSPHSFQAAPAVSVTRVQSGPGIVGNLGALDGVYAMAQSHTEWRRRVGGSSSPSPRRHAPLAYDADRGRVVLFGGQDDTGESLDDTWEWDGERWTQFFPLNTPPPRFLHATAYHSRRGTVMIAGGEESHNQFLRDSWEWDGHNWAQQADGLFTGSGLSMAYDPGRDRIAIFGGWTNSASTFKTGVHEWDGTTWTVTYGGGPLKRARAAMAYHPGRQSIVVFGGCTGVTNATLRPCYQVDAALWEWNGAWSQINLTTVPPARYAHSMVYDPSGSGRLLVLFGDVDDNTATMMSDVWSWDGTSQDWVPLTFADAQPSERRSAGASFDRRRSGLFSFGGRIPGSTSGETWELRADLWTELTPRGLWPEPRSGHDMAYDHRRERVVLFGGTDIGGPYADVWEWNGATWQLGTPVSTPPAARHSHAMAYDGTNVIVHGGYDSSFTVLEDMWAWDGSDWSEIAIYPACVGADTCPSGRRDHAMSYDSSTPGVLLSGGATAKSALDLWLWNGSSWSEIVAASPPNARTNHATSHDGINLWVYGGYAGGYSEELFSYNPTTGWTARTTTDAARLGRHSAHFVCEPTRDQLLLQAGVTTNSVYPLGRLEDAWWADGSDGSWTQASFSPPAPDERGEGAIIYDHRREVIVLFGGRRIVGSPTATDELWEIASSGNRRPALHFDIDAASGGLSRDMVSGLRVRALCGADYEPYGVDDVGAELWGWGTVDPDGNPGGWWLLQQVAEGLTPTTAIDWQAASVAETERFIAGASAGLSFQCRPSGTAGSGESTVVSDYVEVRVRYAAP